MDMYDLFAIFMFIYIIYIIYASVKFLKAQLRQKKHIKHRREITRSILEPRSDIDQKIEGDKNALILAIEEGSKQTVEELLQKGANTNFRTTRRMTPLILASSSGHFDMVKCLIEKGAKIELKDEKNQTAFIVAATHGDFEIAEYLLSQGANYITPKEGNIPLLTYNDWDFLDDGNEIFSILRLYINRGIDINAKRESDGVTALMMYAEAGNGDIVKMLLDAGADIKIRDNKGLSALDYAKKTYEEEISKSRSKKSKYYDFIISFYKEGVDTLQIAEDISTLTETELKEKLYKNKGLLIDLASNGYTNIVRRLIKLVPDINVQDNDGNTSLILASGMNLINIAIELIKNNANVNLANKKGVTPLIAASKTGNFEILNLLAATNTDISVIDNSGSSALLHASATYGKRYTRSVEILLQNGANINNKNTLTGKTALINATKTKNEELIKSLLVKGANIGLRDNEGLTALQNAMRGSNPGTILYNYALTTSHERIIYMLKNKGNDMPLYIKPKAKLQ